MTHTNISDQRAPALFSSNNAQHYRDLRTGENGHFHWHLFKPVHNLLINLLRALLWSVTHRAAHTLTHYLHNSCVGKHCSCCLPGWSYLLIFMLFLSLPLPCHVQLTSRPELPAAQGAAACEALAAAQRSPLRFSSAVHRCPVHPGRKRFEILFVRP